MILPIQLLTVKDSLLSLLSGSNNRYAQGIKTTKKKNIVSRWACKRLPSQEPGSFPDRSEAGSSSELKPSANAVG